MSHDTRVPARVRWARLRFAIIGPLLSAPPEDGTLVSRIAELAARAWKHPTTEDVVRFSAKSIERWYYLARDEQDPIDVLARKVPKHAGTHPSLSEPVVEELRRLRKQHPRWSYQLVYDNLAALGRERPELGQVPGYATVRRFMKQHGLGKQRRPRRFRDEPDFVPRERRLFEVAHVHGLWHCDFHETPRKVLCASGEWLQATLFAVLDDHSRLCCHAQWYVGDGNTESFVHGLCQAFQKRGLPRALLMDYVARHIIEVLCPRTICGGLRAFAGLLRAIPRIPPHNFRAALQGRPHPRVLREGGRKCLSATSPVRKPWIASEAPGSEIRSRRTWPGSQDSHTVHVA